MSELRWKSMKIIEKSVAILAQAILAQASRLLCDWLHALSRCDGIHCTTAPIFLINSKYGKYVVK